MNKHPDWALKHKVKGTELRLIRGKYYLYEISSKWNPEIKRAKKITGKYLGRITEHAGFIKKKQAVGEVEFSDKTKIAVKESGVAVLIKNWFNEYNQLLEKHFPTCWQSIVALSYGKLAFHSAMKNMKFHYQHSFLSELFPDAAISPSQLTKFLRDLGSDRRKIVDFFKEFNQANDNIIFDGTDLLSNSNKMDLPKLSKSKKGSFDSVLNIMFVFSVGQQQPVYYRILPGNIKDIKSFKLSLEEAQIKDAIIIADKGFYSESNIKKLNSENLNYIIPLRRNSSLIDYEYIKTNSKEDFDGFFKYEKNIIWYKTETKDKVKINIYLNDKLKAEESTDYLKRIETHPEKYSLENYYKKQHSFGTLTLVENNSKSPEQVYLAYKERSQVEGMIDVLKNTLEADKSYMQNEQALEAWMFINYIALLWYYKIIRALREHELNSTYSPMDLILFLKEVKKVKINDKWYDAETTAKTLKLLEKLQIHIT